MTPEAIAALDPQMKDLLAEKNLAKKELADLYAKDYLDNYPTVARGRASV